LAQLRLETATVQQTGEAVDVRADVQLLLGALQLGDVERNADHALHAPVERAQRLDVVAQPAAVRLALGAHRVAGERFRDEVLRHAQLAESSGTSERSRSLRAPPVIDVKRASRSVVHSTASTLSPTSCMRCSCSSSSLPARAGSVTSRSAITVSRSPGWMRIST